MRARARWIALPLSLLAALPLAARAATLRVGRGAGFARIGDALRAARPGDTIRVGPGAYREQLELRTTVRIVGEGWPRLVGPRRGNVLRVLAPDVVLERLVVSGSGDEMMDSDAGIRLEGARPRVVGNRLHDNLFGIYLAGCRGARLERNQIVGRGELDVGSRGAGIHLYDSNGNRIAGNTVRLVRDGIYFDHSDRNHVEGNDFSRLRYAIHYMFCDENRFLRNVMRDSVGGAAIMYTQHVTFSENSIYGNRDGYNAFGLLFKDCRESVAERNAIVDNVTGIFLEGAHRNLFRKNLVAYNDVAVELYASSLDNRFTRNDFIHNRAVLHTVGRARADWAADGAGNYYSDYRGFDLDGDGRGDVAHRLQDAFEYLEGNHRLLRLYLSSAAADALAFAERALPVIPRGEARDAAPAMRPTSGARLAAARTRPAGRPTLALLSFGLLGLAGALAWSLRR